MARLGLTTILVPVGVGVASGAFESLKTNAEVVLAEDIAAGTKPATTKLNPIINWLPVVADIGVGVAGPVLYGMDMLRESQGGRELSAAGLAVGGRRLTTMLADTILGIETRGSRKPKTTPSRGYVLREVARERREAPGAYFGSPINVWESGLQ